MRYRYAQLSFSANKIAELTWFSDGRAACASLELATYRFFGTPIRESATGSHFGAAWRISDGVRPQWALYRSLTTDVGSSCWYIETTSVRPPLP
ncbi:hypothetical protein [Sphingomonas sp. CV7422]|uniref:hypothetical protein n=1 Tax=Sphingomonas sp. CV7422 TaxID=3018036 RepID=UPI0022FDF32F|nr:hypothetical protein [Sphingomonas sp. CV7422]